MKSIKADYNLFIDVQVTKYLKSVGRNEFASNTEADFVIGNIIEVYNKTIAPEHLKLDNLNLSAKTTWFNSVEVEFSKDKDKFIDSFDDFVNYDESDNDLFPFLPESLFPLVLFIEPALAAFGLPFKRFLILLKGEEPTAVEEDIISWAVEIVFNVMETIVKNTKTAREKKFSEAVEVAEIFLDKHTALDVINKIKKNILVAFEEEKQTKK